MLRKAASRIAWVGRTASMLFGLALVMALLFGAASVALAGTGVGARFDLGKINKVNAVSSLVGSVSGPTLALQNDRSDRAATALSLEMGNPNLAPMRTNSSATVANLSADSLDGRDAGSFADGTGGKADDADKLDGLDSTAFLPKDLYTVTDQGFGPGDGSVSSKSARCDPGDRVLGGGGGTAGGEAPIFSAAFTNPPSGDGGWSVQVRDNSPADFIIARAICADLPPLRP